MVALAETVGALGQHAQRAEVAAEDEPDELQHEEQRHRDDLQLLDELLPQAVLRLDRRHVGAQRAVADAAGGDVDGLLGVVDGGDAYEPLRRLERVGHVLSDQRLAVAVGPLEPVDLTTAHLVLQQLADGLIFADECLVGDEWRQEDEHFLLLALQTRGVFRPALGKEQCRLHAAADDDRHAHRQHQARDQSPVLPEAKDAHVLHRRLWGPGLASAI